MFRPFQRRSRRIELLSPPDVARRIDRSPSRISRYLSDDLMPAPDAHTAGGQPLWLPETIDAWWSDRTPAVDPTAAPRWLRPHPESGPAPALLAECLVDIQRSRYLLDPNPPQTFVRVYQGVDGAGPVAIVEPLQIEMQDVPLDSIRIGVTALDLDLTPPLWIGLKTWASSWHPEWGEQETLEIDDIWRHDGHHWTPTRTDPHPIGMASIARLIGHPLPIYPRKLLTPALLAAKASTPAGQPVEILTDPQNLVSRLTDLDAILTTDDHPHDPALQFAAGVIADDILRRDRTLTGMREAPREPIALPPGTTRGAVTIPRYLLPEELRRAQQHQLHAPLDDSDLVRDAAGELITSEMGLLIDHKLHPDLLPTLRRLRRHYLNDPHLPTQLRAALTSVTDTLASTWRHADPRAAALESPLVTRTHTYEPNHWLIPAFLTTEFDPVERTTLPEALHWRATQIEPNIEAAEEQWWLRRGWVPAETDEQPDTPALALTLTYTSAERSHHEIHLEWPPLRAPADSALTLDSQRLIAPPADHGVYRPVFIYDEITHHIEPFPSAGKYGPAWGVSSTDHITPAVLAYFGYDNYQFDRDNPEIHDQIQRLLWAGGRGDLNQPLTSLQRLLESRTGDHPSKSQGDGTLPTT